MQSQMCMILLSLLVISWVKAEPDEGRIPKPTDETEEKKKNPLARGWGDSINWMELEDGIQAAKKEKKPLMLLIHKTWCGACQTLKGKFAKAKMVAELAKNFIMVNAEDDEEPWEEDYFPDGGKYIPRILFLFIHAMQKVLQRFGLPVPGLDSKKDKSEQKEEGKVLEKPDKPKSGSDKDESEKAEKHDQPDHKSDDHESSKKDDHTEHEDHDTNKAKEKEDIKKADKELPRKKIRQAKESDEDEPQPPSQKPPKKEL